MNGNRKQSQRRETVAAVVVMGVALLAVPDRVSAQDGQYQVQTSGPQAVFESDKAWKFKDDMLVFFNPSSNPAGVRYIRWKDYTWAITASQITVIDERPYGTQLQGQRGLLTEDGPQKDKDLMSDLKRQAGDIRNSRDPNAGSLPISIGIGLGFDFSRRGGRHSHHPHHH